jgi:hypothetical protein
MDELKTIFKDITDISLMQKKLCQKSILTKAHELLKELHIDTLVKPRIFLSLFLLFHFPSELFTQNENTDDLLSIMTKVMNETNTQELRKHICEYSIAFKKWSANDLEILKNQLLQEYHQLNVDILNTENEDMILVFRTTQEQILKCAKSIGYDEEILNYSPVVIDKEKYEQEYTMALYDTLHVELREKKLVHTKQIMNYVQKFIQLFLPDETNFDIDLLEQIVENDAYDSNEIKSFFTILYDLIQKIQSIQRDEQLKEFRSYLEKDDDVNIPKHLIFLLDCVQSTVDDLENLR